MMVCGSYFARRRMVKLHGVGKVSHKYPGASCSSYEVKLVNVVRMAMISFVHINVQLRTLMERGDPRRHHGRFLA